LLHGNATICLVERDEPTREALADMLRALGYTIIEAASPEMALGFSLAPVTIDLLLCELDETADFVAQLRATRPAMRVIHLGDAGGGPQPPGSLVLSKPVHEPLLARAVLEQLGRLPAVTLTPEALHAAAKLRDRLRNPAIRDLFDRWHGLARTLGRLPTLRDAPRIQASMAGHGYIVEIRRHATGPEFRLTSTGAALRERFARDRPGEVINPSGQDVLASMDNAYRRCLSGHAYFDYAKFPAGPDTTMLFERLLLPVSEDGAHVTHLIGTATFTESARQRRAG
jgi:CheY-like chemotaxis protein